jgi:hypothetical chaperone protein
MPSLLYIDRGHDSTIGAAAAQTYLANETGREVRWRRREVGEIETTVASLDGGPIRFFQTVNVLVDVAANGRLLQSIKRGLFNPQYEGTQIFNRYYRIEDLIAAVLTRLKDAAEQHFDQTCDSVVVGRPVRFSDSVTGDLRAEAILLKAAYMAGFKEIDFAPEPVGIAYLYHQQSAERRTAFVFDFGGGTLDLAVVAVGGSQSPDVLASAGVQVGGDDLDRRIMSALLPHFGAGEDGVVPADLADRLLNWQTMPELSQPANLARIRALRHGDNADMIRMLEALVTRNLGYGLFRSIEAHKRQLSSEDVVRLTFDHTPVHIAETFSRRRFERLIGEQVSMAADAVARVLERAGLQPDDIDVVLPSGGSSQIPIFMRLLTEWFGVEKLRSVHPLISVVGGLAVIAQQGPMRQYCAPESVIAGARGDNPVSLRTLTVDSPCYTDRAFVVNRIPYVLDQQPALLTANDPDSTGDAALCVDLYGPVRIRVAYEVGVKELPEWLRAYEPEDLYIEIEDSFARINRTLRVYGRDVPGGTVCLGGTRAAGFEGRTIVGYLVIVCPKGG